MLYKVVNVIFSFECFFINLLVTPPNRSAGNYLYCRLCRNFDLKLRCMVTRISPLLPPPHVCIIVGGSVFFAFSKIARVFASPGPKISATYAHNGHGGSYNVPTPIVVQRRKRCYGIFLITSRRACAPAFVSGETRPSFFRPTTTTAESDQCVDRRGASCHIYIYIFDGHDNNKNLYCVRLYACTCLRVPTLDFWHISARVRVHSCPENRVMFRWSYIYIYIYGQRRILLLLSSSPGYENR